MSVASTISKFSFFILALSLGLFIAGCSPSHMVKKDARPDITAVNPIPGKSALVIARTTSFGGAIEFDTFLDRQMIGVTKGKSYFIKKDIEPGPHYLSSRAENLTSIILNFEPDKTYYYQHEVRMGIWRARVEMVPESPGHIKSEMSDSCTYYEYDVKDPGQDLSDEEYKDHVEKGNNVKDAHK